jgi:penicillin-binding protein 1C
MKRRLFLRCLLALAFFLAAAVSTFLSCKPPLLDKVSFSRAVFDRQGQLLRLTLSKDDKYRLYTPLHNISPSFRDAVLMHEDKYFYDHPGFNPVALVRAFTQTYISGGRKIGASTISMQVARIQYGINSHSVRGKLWQIARAVQLEAHYSKDQILEAYLNRASYGYNIEGVGAASFIYFHKKPADLTLPEAATLAVIPQSPTRRRPVSTDPTKPALVDARNRLFNEWLAVHPDDDIQKPFFTLPITTYAIADLPFEAPHLTRDLLQRYPDLGQITASIDLETQHVLENMMRHYVADRRDTGIDNASALLVDTQTMQAVASIGSIDFSNRAIQGQVVRARSARPVRR